MWLRDGVLAGVTAGTAGFLPGLTKGCSLDTEERAARALGGGMGTPARRCGPMPSARVGSGRILLGSTKE